MLANSVGVGVDNVHAGTKLAFRSCGSGCDNCRQLPSRFGSNQHVDTMSAPARISRNDKEMTKKRKLAANVDDGDEVHIYEADDGDTIDTAGHTIDLIESDSDQHGSSATAGAGAGACAGASINTGNRLKFSTAREMLDSSKLTTAASRTVPQARWSGANMVLSGVSSMQQTNIATKTYGRVTNRSSD